MTEWILLMTLAGSPEPVLQANGYKTAEQCLAAGDLLKAADEAIRKTGKHYGINCQEVELEPAPPRS